jgi:hypothetical protein
LFDQPSIRARTLKLADDDRQARLLLHEVDPVREPRLLELGVAA